MNWGNSNYGLLSAIILAAFLVSCAVFTVMIISGEFYAYFRSKHTKSRGRRR